MSRFDFVQTIVRNVCAGMGIDDASFDAEGRLTLRFDDMPVTFSHGADPVDALWVHVELGQIPETDVIPPLFLLVLAMDCWGENVMTIALGDDGTTVWGYQCLPAAQLSEDGLRQVVEAMLAVALPLRDRLAEQDYELGLQRDASLGDDDTGVGMLRV